MLARLWRTWITPALLVEMKNVITTLENNWQFLKKTKHALTICPRKLYSWVFKAKK